MFKSKRVKELERQIEQIQSIVLVAMDTLGSPGEKTEYRAYLILGQGMNTLFPDNPFFKKHV